MGAVRLQSLLELADRVAEKGGKKVDRFGLFGRQLAQPIADAQKDDIQASRVHSKNTGRIQQLLQHLTVVRQSNLDRHTELPKPEFQARNYGIGSKRRRERDMECAPCGVAVEVRRLVRGTCGLRATNPRAFAAHSMPSSSCAFSEVPSSMCPISGPGHSLGEVS